MADDTLRAVTARLLVMSLGWKLSRPECDHMLSPTSPPGKSSNLEWPWGSHTTCRPTALSRTDSLSQSLHSGHCPAPWLVPPAAIRTPLCTQTLHVRAQDHGPGSPLLSPRPPPESGAEKQPPREKLPQAAGRSHDHPVQSAQDDNKKMKGHLVSLPALPAWRAEASYVAAAEHLCAPPSPPDFTACSPAWGQGEQGRGRALAGIPPKPAEGEA